MTTVGIIQVHNELTVDPLHLPRVFRSFRRVCDKVVAYDDCSDDGSLDWLMCEADRVIRGAGTKWEEEVQHKALLLDAAKELGADWVLWLDADEELSPGATHDLCNLDLLDNSITGVYIKELNLWRDRQHYRTDSLYEDGWFLRAWRVTPGLEYPKPAPKGLHQPQFPPSAAIKTVRLDEGVSRVVHYSWDSPAKIEAKLRRYCAAGDTKHLQRMVDDPAVVQRDEVPPDFMWQKTDEEDVQAILPWVTPQMGLAHEERVKEAIRSLPRPRRVLEWGAGGSTLAWYRCLEPGDSLFTVEHRDEWSRRVVSEMGRLYVEGGANHALLRPGTGRRSYANVGLEDINLCIVDGEAGSREMCFGSAIALVRGRGGIVFVHDAERLDIRRPDQAIIHTDPSWTANQAAELLELHVPCPPPEESSSPDAEETSEGPSAPS